MGDRQPQTKQGVTIARTDIVTPLSQDKDKTMVHVHLVTLRNPRTEAERLIRIQTLSDRFSVVLMEIQRQRAALGLTGYEIFESLPVTEPECFSDLIAA